MNDVRYSPEAVSVLHKFYDSGFMVFVEGEDDVLFWEIVFSALGISGASVAEKGGCCELDKYCDDVVNGGAKVIVARDSDYNAFSGRRLVHPLIIYTPCHSIENSIYIIEVICSIYKLLTKGGLLDRKEVSDWLDVIREAFSGLIAHEVVKNVLGRDDDILGGSVFKYMDKTCLSSPDRRLISRKIRALEDGMDARQAGILKLLEEYFSVSGFEWMRGHCWQELVHKFIVRMISLAGKKVSVSYESFYAIAISCFEKHFHSHHPHWEYYENEIIDAISALRP